ncbi:hypothetical protein V5070_16880, partial [Moellerella wisconsensis]
DRVGYYRCTVSGAKSDGLICDGIARAVGHVGFNAVGINTVGERIVLDHNQGVDFGRGAVGNKGDIGGFGGAIGAGGDLTDTGEGVGQRGYGGAEIVSVDRVGYYRCTVSGAKSDGLICDGVTRAVGHVGFNAVGINTVGERIVLDHNQGVDFGRGAVGNKGDIGGFGGAIGAGGDLTDTGEGVGQRGYGGAEIVSVDRVGY